MKHETFTMTQKQYTSHTDPCFPYIPHIPHPSHSCPLPPLMIHPHTRPTPTPHDTPPHTMKNEPRHLHPQEHARGAVRHGGVLGAESCPLGAFYLDPTYSNTIGRILSVYMLQVCTRVFLNRSVCVPTSRQPRDSSSQVRILFTRTLALGPAVAVSVYSASHGQVRNNNGCTFQS